MFKRKFCFYLLTIVVSMLITYKIRDLNFMAYTERIQELNNRQEDVKTAKIAELEQELEEFKALMGDRIISIDYDLLPSQVVGNNYTGTFELWGKWTENTELCSDTKMSYVYENGTTMLFVTRYEGTRFDSVLNKLTDISEKKFTDLGMKYSCDIVDVSDNMRYAIISATQDNKEYKMGYATYLLDDSVVFISVEDWVSNNPTLDKCIEQIITLDWKRM